MKEGKGGLRKGKGIMPGPFPNWLAITFK